MPMASKQNEINIPNIKISKKEYQNKNNNLSIHDPKIWSELT